jgi:hypothetical protein
VAEPVLDAPRVMARIGQGIAARVPQHVGVDRKGEASALLLPPIHLGHKLARVG